MPSSARCPGTIAGGSPLPWRTTGAGPRRPRLRLRWVLSQQLVRRRAASASEMHWASMAMQYTATMPSMQAESDGKVKYDNKKKEYKCPCPDPEKVCNYSVFVRVKCIVCASAIRMTRTQNGSFRQAKEGIYVVA